MSRKQKNDYVNGIKSVSFSHITEKVISHRQLKHSKTIDLMTPLRHNDCCSCIEGSIDALVVQEYLGGDFVYIVSKNNRNFEFKSPIGICGETRMTDLKKNYVFRGVVNSLKNCDSKSTVLTAGNKMLHISEKPFILNAMTDYDTNYGNIYHGEDLIEEGNLYGDTSEFYIIGYIDYLDYIKENK